MTTMMMVILQNNDDDVDDDVNDDDEHNVEGEGQSATSNEDNHQESQSCTALSS